MQVSITGLSQFGLPVFVSYAKDFCGLLFSCLFPVAKVPLIVSVSVSHFPRRLATVFVCLTFLAVSFQDFG